MRKPPNKLWALGPFFSILLIAVAYYVKVPAFRDAVNTRFPWAKENLSRFVPAPTIVMVTIFLLTMVTSRDYLPLA